MTELPMLPMAPAPETAPPPADAARFRVDGMDCASCARTVEKAVHALDGVEHAQVSFGTATLLVAGSDVALETADVALMADDLDRLPRAVRHSRRALRIIRQNVVASLAVKAVFVLLAPLGLTTLVIAVAADMGMSLLVTLNALRLLRADG